MRLQFFGQPCFVDLALGKGLQQELGGSGQGANTHDPVEYASRGAAGDEGQILMPDLMLVEERLEVSHSKSSTSSILKAIRPIFLRFTRRLRYSI